MEPEEMMTDPRGAGRRRTLACLAALAAAAASPLAFARRTEGAPAGLEPLDTLPPAAAELDTALAQVRGQSVLVNFWASWCAPCRDEMPALIELTAAGDLALVTVAVADRASDTRRFLDSLRLSPTVVPDPDQRIARNWGISLLPTTLVLDAAHRPRFRVRGERDWLADDVRQLLAPPAASAASRTPPP